MLSDIILMVHSGKVSAGSYDLYKPLTKVSRSSKIDIGDRDE